MSTQVWTVIIDREGNDEHAAEVFASYRDALAVLPARLSNEWLSYTRAQERAGLSYDEASFIDWLGSEAVDSGVEVVIEEHELEPGGCPARLAPEGVRPYVSELVEQLTLEELRHLAGGALHVAAAYGCKAEPSGADLMEVISLALHPAMPGWLPSIDDMDNEAGMDWWAQLRDAPSKVHMRPVPVWTASAERNLR